MTGGKQIRQRRLALGWTQGDLARLSGVSASQVGYAERGGRAVSDDDLRYIDIALSDEEQRREDEAGRALHAGGSERG